jgi:hypothetical protein
MPSDPPFVDLASGSLDTDQLRREAIPIASLFALFAGLALVPFGLSFAFAAGNSALGVLLAVAGQFVLAVGAAVVLLYVVTRAQQLADAS